MSFDKRLEGLATGEFDVIAYGILATSELKDSLLLTTPIVLNKQVLVQRKATSPTDSLFVKSQLDLAGKTLHVVKGSPSILRIRNLGNEIGDTIYIKEIDKYGSEQLISLVAHGDIDYAVCDESIARAVTDSIPQIDINTDISLPSSIPGESANNHLFYWTALTAGFRLFGTVMSLNLSTVNITGLRIRDKVLSNKLIQ